MYVINSLVLMSATPYATHLRSLLHVMYVISSLVLVIHPYATHFRSLDSKTKLLITYITYNNDLR
jgi:hypothetical protein